jgi:hypothetical protein
LTWGEYCGRARWPARFFGIELAGVELSGVRKLALACLALGLLTACMQATALEPQNRAPDARQARIHFIRHDILLKQLGSADIKIDGKLVGSLVTGSHLVVDRPPGPHTITVYGSIDGTGFSSEVNVQPGMSYYYELGPIVRMNIDTVNYYAMGITGQPLPGRSGINSPFMFYALDANAGAAAVAKLKNS